MKPSVYKRAFVPIGSVLPPARPGVRYVRWPRRGTVVADDGLRAAIDRFFHWPMITLALLVLPLLAIEFFWPPEPQSLLWWLWVVGISIIWLAFLIEFVIKIAIAESRFEYAKRNWIDIIIILVPVMRPIRAAYVVRTSRLFTLRGVVMKCARYIITILVGLEATDRLLKRVGLKSSGGRKPPEQMTRYELMSEVKKLRHVSDSWEEWYEAHQEHAAEYGLRPFVGSKPAASEPTSDGEPPTPQDIPASS